MASQETLELLHQAARLIEESKYRKLTDLELTLLDTATEIRSCI